jgi:hypothetical protein
MECYHAKKGRNCCLQHLMVWMHWVIGLEELNPELEEVEGDLDV